MARISYIRCDDHDGPTRGEHANQYTTNVVHSFKIKSLQTDRLEIVTLGVGIGSGTHLYVTY